jgi:glycosyltransferase involved in cell wall biosynthesis
LIRKNDVHLLHLQAFGASSFGRIAGRLLGVPAIVHVHADYRTEPKGYPWYVKTLDRALARGTREVFAVARPVARFAVEMQGFRPEQVHVLHNPVNLQSFKPPSTADRERSRAVTDLTPGQRVVVCIARFHPVKGVDVLVKAWREVMDSVPHAVLLLVGDGPMRQALEEQTRRLSLGQGVRFLGYCRDVKTLLWAADLAVLPSRSEGIPLAALEAMATALPVVATKVGGNPEIVADGVNGYLVPPENSRELGRTVAEVLSGKRDRLETLARGALATAEEHSLSRFVERLRKTYESVAVDRCQIRSHGEDC